MFLGDLGKFLFGHKGKKMNFPTMAPQQTQYQDQLLQGLGQVTPEALSRLMELLQGGPEAFQAFEGPAMQQFQQDIIPEILSRFGGDAGSHGATSGSGLNLALSRAGKDLSTNLAGLRGGLQQQAIGQLGGLSQLGLQQRFQPGYRPPTGGLFGGAAQGIGQGFGSLAGLQGMNSFGMNPYGSLR